MGPVEVDKVVLLERISERFCEFVNTVEIIELPETSSQDRNSAACSGAGLCRGGQKLLLRSEFPVQFVCNCGDLCDSCHRLLRVKKVFLCLLSVSVVVDVCDLAVMHRRIGLVKTHIAYP